jgi:hypothetical protein
VKKCKIKLMLNMKKSGASKVTCKINRVLFIGPIGPEIHTRGERNA